ncbi:metallophosphoesterase [Leptospira sp. 96542]|nr:metallophosphoesterase [Leptospira sp. 96542]
MKKLKFIFQILKYLAIIVFLLFIQVFLVERYYVRFPEYEYKNSKIPKEFDGYRIAVITDVHYGSLDPGFWIQWVFENVKEKNPDVIVGLGDYVKKSKHSNELRNVWPILNDLEAKDGVFLVNGNHDHWANSKLAKSKLEESGKSLENKTTYISRRGSKVYFAGIGDFWEHKTNPDFVLTKMPQNNFKILIMHNPDAINMNHKLRADLVLAGHTHGGQVRIPILNYSPVLPVQNRNFDKGFTKSKYGEDVFISAGMGWSILPVRFFCPAEVPIIVLRSK